MSSSSRSTGKRLPISCQACRTRKIRCSRDGRPCKTCIRRGLGAEDCIYLGQPRLSTEQASSNDQTVHNELLARIRNLEGLLQKQVSSQAGTPVGGATSPLGAPSVTGSFSESEIGGFEAWGSPMLGNIGTLQTSPSGHVRYIPLASQWESVVAKSPAAECLQSSESDIADDDDLQIPLARNGSVSRAELLAILPPSRYCDTLKEVYFRVFSPVFHILHDLTFEAEYQQFYHDPGSVSTSWLALMFAILAIAVSALDDDDSLLSDLGRERTVSRNIKVLSARYRSAALRCLAADGVMTRHSINSLQALVLISYARLHRGLPFWTLLGFTHHVAISMGCHIDPERFPLGSIEREERRRAWAGMMMLYTIQNSSFGSLDQSNISQDVKMPIDVDDVDLLTGSGIPPTSDPTSSPSATRPTQMTYLLLSTRLHKISNRICEHIFTYTQSRFTSDQLESELFAIQEICDARYQDGVSGNHTSLPIHHQANLHILRSHIDQLFLLILRPKMCRFLQGEVTTEMCTARGRCMSVAKSAISTFQTLLESSQFAGPYKWYTSGLGSFHAFHAAVVLAVGLLNPESQADFDETKELLGKALDLFASLSVRSIFCSKAVPIVRQIIEIASTQYTKLQQQQSLSQPQPQSQTPSQAQTPLHSQTPQPQHHPQTPLHHPQMFTTLPSALTSAALADSYALAHSQSLSPVPTVSSSCSDPTMQSSFGIHLHPQNWLGPTSVPWDSLGSSVGHTSSQYGFESDVI
ncbi:uncharacterized protein N7469_003758 [Penicillium citrinum]|uniref:Zn(2)-C6 fungal-type domain-containing protein n=1 Tax=Penicillium citrinum TaxID=5077 RepID=A0A9W9P3C7_PENCI|nr:uncharacterized protein N7469_003758 [Penicillium citrinum]KAJ5234590.1 hypothetical protein N7469_003758 [Penicillium citrinum]